MYAYIFILYAYIYTYIVFTARAFTDMTFSYCALLQPVTYTYLL